MKRFKIALLAISTVGLLNAGGDIAPDETPMPVAFPIPFYVGVGALWSGTSFDCRCAGGRRMKETTYGGILRVGADYNQYIGVEARFLKGSIDKNFAETTHYGIYLKPQVHVSDAVNVYGLIGYGNTKVEASCGAVKRTVYDAAGVSFGMGMEFDLKREDFGIPSARGYDNQGDQEQGFGLWVDYQNLVHNKGISNVKANVVTMGVTYDF